MTILVLTKDEFTLVQLAVASSLQFFSENYKESFNTLVDKFNENLDEEKNDLDLTDDEFTLIRLAVAMNLTDLCEIDKRTLTGLIKKFVQKLKEKKNENLTCVQ